jgi:hypothetical protein
MVFVPEGQHGQARSAWNHEENSLVPAGRLTFSTGVLGDSEAARAFDPFDALSLAQTGALSLAHAQAHWSNNV